MDPIISQIIQGTVGIVLVTISSLLPRWIKTSKKKNQSIEWLNIARGIVSLILINNPKLPWKAAMENAINQLMQTIQGIKPEIAKRLVADALYEKGVIGAKEGVK